MVTFLFQEVVGALSSLLQQFEAQFINLVEIFLLQEVVVALSSLVQQFESQFTNVVVQWMEEERQKEKSATVTGEVPGGWNLVSGTTGNHVLSSVPSVCCLFLYGRGSLLKTDYRTSIYLAIKNLCFVSKLMILKCNATFFDFL